MVIFENFFKKLKKNLLTFPKSRTKSLWIFLKIYLQFNATCFDKHRYSNFHLSTNTDLNSPSKSQSKALYLWWIIHLELIRIFSMHWSPDVQETQWCFYHCLYPCWTSNFSKTTVFTSSRTQSKYFALDRIFYLKTIDYILCIGFLITQNFWKCYHYRFLSRFKLMFLGEYTVDFFNQCLNRRL